MARFVENYPEFRKKSGNVSKHVSLMSELSRIVDERLLMSVSQVEQDLACTASQATAYEEVSPFPTIRLFGTQTSGLQCLSLRLFTACTASQATAFEEVITSCQWAFFVLNLNTQIPQKSQKPRRTESSRRVLRGTWHARPARPQPARR
jgi:hypothetical protein